MTDPGRTGRHRPAPHPRSAQAHRAGPAVGLPRIAGSGRGEGADVPAAAQHRGARADSRGRQTVAGVRYRGSRTGRLREMRADLTVACDGRALDTARRRWDCSPRASARRWTCGGSGCRATTTTRPAWTACSASGHAMLVIDRGDYYQIAYIIPKGARCASCGPRASSPCSARVVDAGALAGRPGRGADVVRRRQTARRAAEPAAPLVHRRPAADRRRGARDVTGRRGRDQPGRRRRRRGGRILAGPLRAGHGRHQASWPAIQARRWVPDRTHPGGAAA